MADIVGPKAEEFLLKVQEANKGPPWYMESPKKVRPTLRSLCAVAFVEHRLKLKRRPYASDFLSDLNKS